MGQYCFASWCLSSAVVCNTAGGRAGRRWSSARHCTASQYGYVLLALGRHLVSSLKLQKALNARFCDDNG